MSNGFTGGTVTSAREQRRRVCGGGGGGYQGGFGKESQQLTLKTGQALFRRVNWENILENQAKTLALTAGMV